MVIFLLKIVIFHGLFRNVSIRPGRWSSAPRFRNELLLNLRAFQVKPMVSWKLSEGNVSHIFDRFSIGNDGKMMGTQWKKWWISQNFLYLTYLTSEKIVDLTLEVMAMQCYAHFHLHMGHFYIEVPEDNMLIKTSVQK
jgi:hypothetical protein